MSAYLKFFHLNYLSVNLLLYSTDIFHISDDLDDIDDLVETNKQSLIMMSNP